MLAYHSLLKKSKCGQIPGYILAKSPREFVSCVFHACKRRGGELTRVANDNGASGLELFERRRHCVKVIKRGIDG
jgi:hypothetical protein